MRYLLLAALATGFLLAACGGGDEVPDELKGVCTQRDEAATDTIEVSSPRNGDEIASPLTVEATITIEQPILYIYIVAADGTHITDYPARPDAAGTALPFQQSVPFGVEEETPACLWVSHLNQQDPADAIRVPITLLPGGTR